jgi:hypothetical protein
MSGISVKLEMLDRLVELNSTTIVMKKDGTLDGIDGKMESGDGIVHTFKQQKYDDNKKVLLSIYRHVAENISDGALERLNKTKINGLTLGDHVRQGTTVSSQLVKELRQITRDVVMEDSLVARLGGKVSGLSETDSQKSIEELEEPSDQIAPGLLEQDSDEFREPPELPTTKQQLAKVGLTDNTLSTSDFIEIGKKMEAPKNIENVKKLGGGGGGTAYSATIDGKECVLKMTVMGEDQIVMSLKRTGNLDESMSVYLTSEKPEHRDYLSQTVNITQPTLYLISVVKDGERKDKVVDPQELRNHLKEPGSTIVCHGLIMPKAEGKEVQKLITDGELTRPSEKKQFIKSMLDSIKGLNQRGFVHRDLKPLNSFFDKESGKTTLIDTGSLFKTPKNEDKPGQYLENLETPFGTPMYMHPRALLNQRHGTETDLYALGVMALQVDHPKAFGELMRGLGPLQFEALAVNGGITKEWLLKQLKDKIDKAKPGELKLDMERLRHDLDDPKKLSGFGMQCLTVARISERQWNDRIWSQDMYQELQEHPVFN